MGDDGTLRLWETDAEQLERMGRARGRHRAVAPLVDALFEAGKTIDEVRAALRREPGLDASLLRTAQRLAVARAAGASEPPGAK